MRMVCPLGEQNFYYLNSELRERYFVSADGTEYGHHIWWYENGIVSKVIIYCAAAKRSIPYSLMNQERP